MADQRGYQSTIGEICVRGSFETCTHFFYEGFPYRLQRFESSEEAMELYRKLLNYRHQSIPRMTPVFTVAGKNEWCIGFLVNGTRMDVFLASQENRAKLSRKHVLLLYKDVIMELISLVNHLLKRNIPFTLSLENIYIIEHGHQSSSSLLSLVSFEGEVAGVDNYWPLFASFMDSLNLSCEYSGGPEMEKFLDCLRSIDPLIRHSVSRLPLFWTLEERRCFVINFVEYGHNCPSKLFPGLSVGEGDDAISKVEKNTDLTEMRRINHVFKMGFLEDDSLDKLRSLDGFLTFLRNVFIHYIETTLIALQEKITISSFDDLHLSIEDMFPSVVYKLHEVYSARTDGLYLPPPKPKLAQLFPLVEKGDLKGKNKKKKSKTGGTKEESAEEILEM